MIANTLPPLPNTTPTAAAATTAAHGPALHQQLLATAQALHSVRQGQSATAVLAAQNASLRPGVQALLFHTLRHLGQAQALRALLVARPPAPKVDALLCCALALLVDTQNPPYPAFTLVNQAVEAARRGGMARQAGFINANLRRLLREHEALLAQVNQQDSARYNHPQWWIDKLRQQYPQNWQAILEASNRPAPLSLRLHPRHTDPSRYCAALAAQGHSAQAFGQQGVQLEQALPVQQLPGFAEGWCSVQDGAAQLAAPLLLDGLQPPPLHILDACAAPGGKTAHLLELLEQAGQTQARVYALEVDAQRSQRIHDNLQRLGLEAQAQVLVADAAQPPQWWQAANQGQPLDAILLDAPCSASGIVRRHPDVRWLRRASDIAQLAALQQQLLEQLWPLLRPGGRLLYCTCSFFKEEGQWQIQAFAQRHPEAQWLASPGHLLPSAQPVPDNQAGDHDGFFYALLQKAA